LVVDPTKRYNAEKILAHPWIVGEKTPRKQLPNVTDKIREFSAKKEAKVILTRLFNILEARRWKSPERSR
jgi:serine/threonine protein kinase